MIIKIISTLIFSIAVLCAPLSVADIYFCTDIAGVSINKFGMKTSNENTKEITLQNWLVDTNKGWRREDVEGYAGACETNKGYVVCRAEDVVFGEAIFSIHPDDSNFVLTYLDYGLDALSYVGTCKKP
ncbi:MAG: hypothetical protein P8J52_06915 [Gammaproteobacteria bacterium]|nr:hypothetical protein [Gammaproteobacteria bacterium]